MHNSTVKSVKDSINPNGTIKVPVTDMPKMTLWTHLTCMLMQIQISNMARGGKVKPADQPTAASVHQEASLGDSLFPSSIPDMGWAGQAADMGSVQLPRPNPRSHRHTWAMTTPTQPGFNQLELSFKLQ